MPEYSEVRLTSEYINAVNEGKIIVDVEFLSSNKLKIVEELKVIGTNLSGKSRGKELKLYFDYDSVVITLGMSGGFKLFNQSDETNLKWKHGHIRFKLNDGSYFVWHDVRRFGKSLGRDWSYSKRGPDMFDETEKFISNILENKDHKIGRAHV
jgi:endonuclease VIII-like 1